MYPSIRLLLVGILVTLAGAEFAWALEAHFEVDLVSLAKTSVVATIPFVGGVIYTVWRRDERVAAMLFAIAYLLLLAPLCTILSNFAVSVAGHRIDNLLAHIDRGMGFYWPSLVALAGVNGAVIGILGISYEISAFQLAIPVVLLGFNGEPREISKLCIAATICALLTIVFWTAFPSFGAYTVYDLGRVARTAHVVIDPRYPNFLNVVLTHGTGVIDPENTHGLIGFPSFHTQEIVLAAWYSRSSRFAFWPLFVFSLIALLSVPIQGGHHVVDIFGGFVFSAVGIRLAMQIVERLTRPKASPALRPVPIE